MNIPHIQSILEKLTNLETNKAFDFQNIHINGDEVALEVVLAYPAKSQFESIREQIQAAIVKKYPQAQVHIGIETKIIAHKVQNNLKPLPGIKNIIAIASGKGGVGKSTTAVNIALALHQEGASVGILDADLYGPSQPLMLGLSNQMPNVLPNQKMQAPENYGIKVMSIGFLIQTDDTPMIWRGPMVSATLEQILNQTEWGELDYLIVDLPPGTGDAQLTLSQKVPLSGAVIVTTPQDIALIDAKKGLKMFEKVNIPILGIVENMSLFVCPKCQAESAIFGKGGADKMQQEYGVTILGKLPLSLSIRENADSGKPSVIADSASSESAIYKKIARQIAIQIALRPKDYSAKLPKVVVEN